MITQHQFHLSVYSDDEESDTPQHFFITLDMERASYFLRRIALLENIEKVDHQIQKMVYSSEEGTYYFEIDGSENSTPVLSSEATSIESHQVHVDEGGIWWISFHGSSGHEITTSKIERFMLHNLSKGLNPLHMENNPLGQLYEASIHGFVSPIGTPLPSIPPLPTALFAHQAEITQQQQNENEEHHDVQDMEFDEGPP